MFFLFTINVIIFFYIYSITSASKLLIGCDLVIICTDFIPQEHSIWCWVAKGIGERYLYAESSEFSPRDAPPLGFRCLGFHNMRLLFYTEVLISPQPGQEGKKQIFLSEWREFSSAMPCRIKNLMTARVPMLFKWRSSLQLFHVCFLPGPAMDLSATGYYSF